MYSHYILCIILIVCLYCVLVSVHAIMSCVYGSLRVLCSVSASLFYYACQCAHVYVCVHVCACVCMCVCVCVFACMHVCRSQTPVL